MRCRSASTGTLRSCSRKSRLSTPRLGATTTGVGPRAGNDPPTNDRKLPREMPNRRRKGRESPSAAGAGCRATGPIFATPQWKRPKPTRLLKVHHRFQPTPMIKTWPLKANHVLLLLCRLSRKARREQAKGRREWHSSRFTTKR